MRGHVTGDHKGRPYGWFLRLFEGGREGAVVAVLG